MAIRYDVTIDWTLSPRLLTVLAPSTEISVQDIVDTCRYFEDSDIGVNYEYLIDAAGKEPLGGVTYVGITATLNNCYIAFEARLGPNWILCTIAGGNIVAVDAVGAELDPRYPTAYVSVDRTASSSATLQEQGAIQYSSYSGGVWISTAGSPGTEYPLGTPAYPVNNIPDAHTIMAANGFDKIFFLSDWTFTSAMSIMSGHELWGQGSQKTVFTFESGAVLAYCEVFDAECTGSETGIVGFNDCLINDLGSVGLFPSSVEVLATNCLFKNTLTLPSNYSGTITAVDCWALPTSGGNPPIIDAGNSTASIQVRNWSGLLDFRNVTNDVDIRIFLSSGGVILDPSVTAGDFLISGVGTLTNNSTSVTALDTEGLMSKDTVSEAIWDEPIGDHIIEGTTGHEMYHASYGNMVHVDVINGSSGTVYPVGTHEDPVNNLPDALTIAKDHNFQRIHCDGALTINGENITGYTFIADRSIGNSVTVTSMTNSGACYFENLTVSGTLSGATRFTTSVLGELRNYDGGAKNCLLTNDIYITGSGANYFTDCDTYVTGYINKTIHVGDNYLNLIRCRGAYNIADYTGSHVLALDFSAAIVVTESTCVSGTIIVSGLVNLTDNSGPGCNVIDGTISEAGIVDKTWDESTSTHQVSGSFGEKVSDIKIDTSLIPGIV